MRLRVSQLVAVHPKKVFVLAGTNSLSFSKDDFEMEYKSLLDSIQESLPYVKVYILNIIPQCDGTLGNSECNHIIRERNEFIKEYAKSKKICYIDLYSLYVDKNGDLNNKYTEDGVHILSEAYSLWADLIKSYVYME